jgi:hypothetical protein
MHARRIIERFGGEAALGSALGVGKSSVAYWSQTDVIPVKWHARLHELGKARGIDLADDLAASGLLVPTQHAAFRSVAGIGMGVRPDGQVFLGDDGLARLCGVAVHALQRHPPLVPVPLEGALLRVHGSEVCLAVLKAHAIDSPRAKNNRQLLEGAGLRDLVLAQTAYDPRNRLPLGWKQFQEQVSPSYDTMQPGFFGVFKEMADVIIALGQAGIHVSSSLVPDTSVGLAWSTHWVRSNFDAMHGPRRRHEHDDADLFPQSLSKLPERWRYPAAALDEFRRWLYAVFIGQSRFQRFRGADPRQAKLPVSVAQLDL